MNSFKPGDPEFGARVRASFARQAMMTTLGATVERVAPGEVDCEVTALDRPPGTPGDARSRTPVYPEAP